jgi:hypothetical protein
MTTKKGRTTNFFSPFSFLFFMDPGTGMDKNQDPGSVINIPDPQHRQEMYIRYIGMVPREHRLRTALTCRPA